MSSSRHNYSFRGRRLVAAALTVVAATAAASVFGAFWGNGYQPLATARGDLGRAVDGAPRLCIVYLLVDTLRADHVSCYGYKRPTTPNLDALAAESIVFENNKSQSAMTVISMASTFQSRYLIDTSLPPGRGQEGATFAEVLQSAGYRTIGIQTNPGLSRKRGYGRGFDKYSMTLPEGQKGILTGDGWANPVDRNVFYVEADEVAHLCEEAIRDAGEEPLFLYAHFMDVHGPYIPADEYQVFGERKYDLRGALSLCDKWVRLARSSDPDQALPLRDDIVALYDAQILQADAAVGRILQAVKEAGAWERALVIIAADHGEGFLAHGLVLHANSLYEEVIHTPLIMKIPGKAPMRYAGLTRNVDIAPTVYEAAGVETVWEDRDGVSLLTVLDGRYRIRESVGRIRVKMTEGIGTLGSLQAETTKYIWSVTPWHPFQEELYNLADDPAEKNDLSKAEPATVRALAAVLATRGGSQATHEEIPYDDEALDALRALGYL